mmetsp:Transcript_16792/g.25200  ORF Transcript_16792/g.25200 Transcript_16792/m.25200 type:complete len:206 (-) Transcript_16792:1094-1711(-)
MAVHSCLHIQLFIELFLHPKSNFLSQCQIMIGTAACHDEVATELLGSIRILDVGVVCLPDILVLPCLRLVPVLAMKLLELGLERSDIIRILHSIVKVKHVILGLKVLIVKVQILIVLNVDLIHPILKRSHGHICLIIFRLQLYNIGILGCKGRNLIIPKPLIIPQEFIHISFLTFLPGELEVTIPGVRVTRISTQLRHPVVQNER